MRINGCIRMLRTNKNTFPKLFYLEGSYTELASDLRVDQPGRI